MTWCQGGTEGTVITEMVFAPPPMFVCLRESGLLDVHVWVSLCLCLCQEHDLSVGPQPHGVTIFPMASNLTQPASLAKYAAFFLLQLSIVP